MARRGARSLDDIEMPPWRAIVFGDLHVSTRTLDRTLAVLRRIREEALRLGAWVFFVGDFWDARGVLSVRQLDAILDELHRWREAGLRVVMLPGNHDQVTLDGTVHGIRFAEVFPNITVATHRVLWHEYRIAFLPWREDPEEQSALFTSLPGTGWTIFAHAEVAGAVTNHAHKAVGRVTPAQIEAVARACYCGHYHKAQKLGEVTWYVGSQYEQTFGEMGDPKGIAVVSSDRVDPEFILLNEFPKHHRVTLGVPFDIGAIREQDIVELYVPPDRLGTEDVTKLVQAIPARDVRPLPLKVPEKGGDAPPAFALTLEQAIDAYVDEQAEAAENAGTDLVHGLEPVDLKGLARAVLAELPEARAINPLTPRCEIVYVDADHFCGIGGRVVLDLDKRGLVLLKGRVGSGKTALAADALMWCLFGETAPRKAGANGASFRGDEVIHDGAPSCTVRTKLRLADGREAVVVREKKRGKGATLRVDGFDVPTGIADTQQLVHRLVGLDYDLARACVSLGQGAVGNFVTDADKRRKEALSTVFGLTACPPAQKLVRDRLKPLRVQVDRLNLEIGADQRVIDELGKSDLTEQIDAFEKRREAAKEAARVSGEQAKAAIAECDRHLAAESAWLGRKAEHDAHIDGLIRQIAQLGTGARSSDLERKIGAAQSERSTLERDLAKAMRDRDALQSRLDSGAVPCPTCGKPMEATHAEQHVAEKGHEVERIQRGMRTLDLRITEAQTQLDALRKGTEGTREQLEQQLAASRAALHQIGEALSAFTRIRANRDEAERRLADARALWEREDQSTNPFIERQSALAAQLAGLRAQNEERRALAAQLAVQAGALAFWEEGFGQRGVPVLVLRTAIFELEQYANRFLSQILGGRIVVQLAIAGDDLAIRFFEQKRGELIERRYEQLSGGQRRCVELAFSPFAFSEMVFNRCGVRVPLLVIDELTTHLGQEEKPLVCEVLRSLDRDTVLVIDHDAAVQGEFDVALELRTTDGGQPSLTRAT